ncbi:hypothetical protein K0U27_06045 [archaeon]|nr:hypothetical protein [archaeon]
MSTTQCLTKVRQPESRTNLVASIPVEEGQKLSPTNKVLEYPWQEIQGLSWTTMEEEY